MTTRGIVILPDGTRRSVLSPNTPSAASTGALHGWLAAPVPPRTDPEAKARKAEWQRARRAGR